MSRWSINPTHKPALFRPIASTRLEALLRDRALAFTVISGVRTDVTDNFSIYIPVVTTPLWLRLQIRYMASGLKIICVRRGWHISRGTLVFLCPCCFAVDRWLSLHQSESEEKEVAHSISGGGASCMYC